MLVHPDQPEGKPWMNNCDGRQGTGLRMLRKHRPESKVSDLVTIQSKESLIINVTAYRERKSFARSSWYRMDAVLDSYSKACSIPKEVDYLLLQIGDAHHNIRQPAGLEPLDNPLKKRLSSHPNETPEQIRQYGSQPNTFAPQPNHPS